MKAFLMGSGIALWVFIAGGFLLGVYFSIAAWIDIRKEDRRLQMDIVEGEVTHEAYKNAADSGLSIVSYEEVRSSKKRDKGRGQNDPGS